MDGGIAIWWIKRDVRLTDNAAYSNALADFSSVLPVSIAEPSILNAEDCSILQQHAQFQALDQLRNQLRLRGEELFHLKGEAVEAFESFHRRFPFRALYSHEEIGNGLTFQRDRAVAAWCHSKAIAYREFPQSSVKRGGVSREHLQRWWKARIVETPPIAIPEPRPWPGELRRVAAETERPRLRLPRSSNLWQPCSETDAGTTLADFLNRRGRNYRGGISSPNTAFTAGSRLSIHLAWGTITTRRVWHALRERIDELKRENHPELDRWTRSLEAFQSRLHWRDHFAQRLESEPDLEFRSIHPAYRNIPYENSDSLHAAWCEGRTGFPLVDAVMRCLAATGFVNFRMRAMAVSFACHALHSDWRFLHPHLARVFRDYDPGIHMSQLQMQAGVVGWNAIRVYSPAKQLEDWDADCRFVKRWLPELRGSSPEAIAHRAEESVSGYIPPIIDFAVRTKQMKDWLYGIRKTAEAQAATGAVYAKHGSRRKETRFPRKAKVIKVAKPSTQLKLF